MSDRAALVVEWLELTRAVLPGMAEHRRWPVQADHCFQRILLDAVCGGAWYDHVEGRPAYRAISLEGLEAAVKLAQAVAFEGLALEPLDAQSLAWRRARSGTHSNKVR